MATHETIDTPQTDNPPPIDTPQTVIPPPIDNPQSDIPPPIDRSGAATPPAASTQPTPSQPKHTPVKAKLSSKGGSRPVNNKGPITDIEDREAKNSEMDWFELPLGKWFKTSMADKQLPAHILERQLVKFIVQLQREPSDRPGQTNEARMTPGLCQGFEDIMAQLGLDDELEVRDTSDLADTVTGDVWNRDHTSTIRPDLGWYPANHVDGERENPDREDNTWTRWKGRVDWGTVDVLGEIKHATSHGAFPNGGFNTIEESSQRQWSRGQILDYVTPLFRRQHRTFCYVLAINHDHCRFIRVDREGALVSEAFNYIEDSLPFYRFFYNYKHATSADRGFDPTVTVAGKKDQATFRKVQHDSRWTQTVRDAFKVAATEYWPVHRLEMDADQFDDIDEAARQKLPEGANGKKVRRFLIGRATFSSSSITGRATRIFPAYDLAKEEPALVKDVWRPDAPAVVPEVVRYRALKDAGVPYIPTLLGGGDVGGTDPQRTISQDYDQAPDKHVSRIHARLVLKEICRSLESFRNAHEFAVVMTHALNAHGFAFEKLDLLHRDVSANNILIFDDPNAPKGAPGTGLLADWDLARTIDEIKKQQTSQTSRSGTWQFMSALLLRFSLKAYELSDDLESFIHIFNWIALKYFSHTMSGADAELQHHVMLIYDKSVGTAGGHEKLRILRGPDPFVTLVDDIADSSFNTVLVELNQMLKDHYKTVDFGALERSTRKKAKTQTVLHTFASSTVHGGLSGKSKAGGSKADSSTPSVLTEAHAQPPAPETPLPSRLEDHMAMFTLLCEHLKCWFGADSDKLDNQFAHFCNGRGKYASASTIGSKRNQPDSGFHESREDSVGRVTRSASKAAIQRQSGSLHGQPILEETHAA